MRELGQGSRYWSRFSLDGDKVSVAIPSGIQATTAAGTRGRFYKDKLPAQSAGRDL